MSVEKVTSTYKSEQLSAALYSLLVSVARSMPRDISRTGVSVLNTLEQIDPQRITRLAEIENVTQPTMTLLIDKLQLMGLVERHRDNDDRRATLISLTRTGKSYLSQRRRIGTERISDLIANLPSEQTNLLIDALTAITNLSRIGTTILSTDRSISHPTKGGR